MEGLVSIFALVVSIVSTGIAGVSVWMARRLQEEQWWRSGLEVRRDVLRRLSGYRYRLTEGRMGQDGEPFVALNEAWVVFAEFPEVRSALVKMHMGLGEPDRLSENHVSLVRAMAGVARVPVDDIYDVMLGRPFTPPSGRVGPGI